MINGWWHILRRLSTRRYLEFGVNRANEDNPRWRRLTVAIWLAYWAAHHADTRFWPNDDPADRLVRAAYWRWLAIHAATPVQPKDDLR